MCCYGWRKSKKKHTGMSAMSVYTMWNYFKLKTHKKNQEKIIICEKSYKLMSVLGPRSVLKEKYFDFLHYSQTLVKAWEMPNMKYLKIQDTVFILWKKGFGNYRD